MTLKHLILIASLDIEDPIESRITELAILNNTTTKEIKELSVAKVEEKLKEIDFLYDHKEIKPLSQFTLEGKTYYLPADLGLIAYSKWEDTQRILKNNRFGENDWEKFRYVLDVLANPNYDATNIEESSKKFLDLPAKEVLGLINFFTSQEKSYLLYTQTYSKLVNLIQ